MYFEAETEMISEKIKDLCKEKKTLIIAIDGRCASGKTTLAKELSEKLDCSVIHADDFYLQSYQRTENRYAEPGGNLDRERFFNEVLLPLSKGEKPVYRPLVCSTMDFGEEIILKDKNIYILEGSYSCHPELRSFYDITVFVSTDSDTQQKRILERSDEDKLKMFIGRWIPLEEKYFEVFEAEKKADIIIRT